MAGAVIAAGLIGCTAVLAVGLVVAGEADVSSRQAASAADAAALAAADTVSGLVPGGDPCERAAEVAEASGAQLADCGVDGLTATVRVRVAFGSLAASARARAGPSPEP